MKKILQIVLVVLLFLSEAFSQSLPPNAILKNYHPFSTPRTNGRPGEVYRINEEGKKYIVQDIIAIKEKVSEEDDLVGRMYFTADELLTLLNLEFDRLEVIPCEVKILKAKREYTEQTAVDKVLYGDEKIRELLVDENSTYFIIREAILSKEVTFRFSHEVVKKIKRGSSSLTKVETKEEIDFPFEIKKKFKKEKRLFFLEQQILSDPYDL
ncbi:MAG: hypothetical protein OQJ81_04680 [Melioribacteraceae bacterium]|nr:hypothetical protein [Melioribacteraceae bacterium]